MKKETSIIFPWNTLLSWYKSHGRHHLPWRQYEKYENNQGWLLALIWLSEILLQQTQAERVIPYLHRILERFPTIEALAKSDYDTFFPYYQWMGYYSRARNILKTAKLIHEWYDSIFPSDEKLLKNLPWIWPYTASAIRWFGYGIPVLAWDTNLDKVFSRYVKGRKDIRLSNSEKSSIESDFKNFIEQVSGIDNQIQTVRDINNALMDFSRIVDDKNPDHIDWEAYPIQSWLFYQTRWVDEPKWIKKWVRFPIADAHVIVVIHENHKKYYSSHTDKYTPFILQWVWENDVRKYVQGYFREKHNIELSVRPVHKKWMGHDDIPYVAVYAQIQRGFLEKGTHKKEDIQDILSQYKK